MITTSPCFMRLSLLHAPALSRPPASAPRRAAGWLISPLILLLLSTAWLSRPALSTPHTPSPPYDHYGLQLPDQPPPPDDQDAVPASAGSDLHPPRPEQPPQTDVLMLYAKFGWAQFYDVQTPPRRLDRFPYYERSTRIGGMRTAESGTRRLGQLFATGCTGRILPLNPHRLSADITAHFMTIIPHGPWLNHQAQFSPASSIHEFALSTTIARQHALAAMHLKYGLLTRLETTSFNNFITGHRRRALLIGAMLTAGTLARARLTLAATTAISHSFRFYTVESSRSFKLTTTELPYHNFELEVAKHLLDQLVGKVTLIWRPSDVTVANINEYTHHGFPISATSRAGEPATHSLTITQLTFGITKVF